jgi:predicted unusual protein kinase regulating ubiquinone biosynthesis (AarF/ABC1/UbiB family)
VKLKSFFYLITAAFLTFSSVVFSAEDTNLFTDKVNDYLLNQLQQTKPFHLTGQDKLLLKLSLLELVKNNNIQTESVKSTLDQLKDKIRVVKKDFQSFAEYIEFEKKQWPESGDLSVDFERIKKVGIELVEPSFQNEESRNEWQENEKNKQDFLARAGIGVLSVAGVSKDADEKFLDAGKIQVFVESYKKHIVSSLREMFSGDGDGFVKEAFPVLISEYFQNAPLDMKMNMIAGLLDEAFPYGQKVLVNSLFSNSGPNLQKMVQILGRDKSIDDKWKDFFQSFESEVRPVPLWQVKELLQKAKFPFEIVEFNDRPLGVGTIAQTHLGKVRLKDGSVVERVFRFIKPGVFQKALHEKEVILAATKVIDNYPAFQNKNFPKLTSMADNVYYMIVDDMNLKKAMKKQITALDVYTRSDIYVPEIWLSQESEPLFMVQSKAEGMKLSKYSKAVQRKVLNRLVQFWLEEAMFGSGYFHSDMHQGNFLVKLRSKLSGDDKELKSILDYGMFGRLSAKDRTNLMGLFLSLKAQNTKALTNISWSLANKNESQISKKELFKNLEMKYGQKSSEEFSLEDMLKYFAEIKLELNQNILEFLRGAIALSSQLKEVDSKNSLLTNAVEVAMRHPIQAMKVYDINEISLKDVLKVAWDETFSKKQKSAVAASVGLRKESRGQMCLGYY